MYALQFDDGSLYGTNISEDGGRMVPRIFPTIHGAKIARTMLGLGFDTAIVLVAVKTRALPKALSEVNA